MEKQQKLRPSKLRSLTAGVLGTIALWAIVSAVLAIWSNRLLTNTDNFTTTVSTITAQPEIQKTIGDKIADILLNQAPRDELAAKLLPQGSSGLNAQQVEAQLTTTVQTNVRQIVSSAEFQALWRQSLNSAHSQLIGQLNNNAATNGSVNLHPLITGVLDQLKNTDLAFLATKNLNIPANAGVIEIPSKQFNTLRTGYQQTKRLWLILVAVAIVFTALMIFVSPRKLRSIRNLSLCLAIAMAIVALLTSYVPRQAPHLIKSGDRAVIQAASSSVQILTQELLRTAIIVAVVASLVVIAITAWQMRQAKQHSNDEVHQVDVPQTDPVAITPHTETEVPKSDKQ